MRPLPEQGPEGAAAKDDSTRAPAAPILRRLTISELAIRLSRAETRCPEAAHGEWRA
jgi:hypothetical protein